MLRRLLLIASLSVLVTSVAARAQEPLRPKQLWLYYPANLLPDENLKSLETVWRRAAKAGYTHVLLTDVKLSHLSDLPPKYAQHVEEVRALADELHLQLVPAVAGFGYSESLLWHNPNLAEAVPVRGTLMEAQGKELKLVPDPSVTFGKPAFVDDSVKITGNTATLVNPPGNARICYSVAVQPFRAYHISVSIETQGFTGTPEIKALADKNASLQWQSLGVKRTQPATTHHVVFNSLANTKVNIYLGVWGGGKGRLIWRDWTIEELPPMNVLRRPGTPVVVTSVTTGKPLTEGRDYDPIADPVMGTQPWPGSYTCYHTPPTLRTSLANGTRVRVDWFYPPIVYDGQVTMCPAEPETWKVVAREMSDVAGALRSGSFFLGFDEIRVLGWDHACEQGTPGTQLAAALRKATDLAGKAGSKNTYVWSDMFDPYHNAKSGPYYLVNGSLSPGPVPANLVICNWNFEQRDESLAYFANKGHRQIIAAYYDGPLDNTRLWLLSGAKVKGVEGLMYCTWRGDYSQLEAFAKLAGK
jgi:hypothetical protein